MVVPIRGTIQDVGAEYPYIFTKQMKSSVFWYLFLLVICALNAAATPADNNGDEQAQASTSEQQSPADQLKLIIEKLETDLDGHFNKLENARKQAREHGKTRIQKLTDFSEYITDLKTSLTETRTLFEEMYPLAVSINPKWENNLQKCGEIIRSMHVMSHDFRYYSDREVDGEGKNRMPMWLSFRALHKELQKLSKQVNEIKRNLKK